MSNREDLEKKFQNALGSKNFASIQFHCPRFVDFLPPEGVLADHPACHALWYYAIIVRRRLFELTEPQYDDTPFDYMKQNDLKQLFLSIATMYGVQPDHMIKFWVNVDAQQALIGSKKIPREYRFDNIPEVKTQ